MAFNTFKFCELIISHQFLKKHPVFKMILFHIEQSLPAIDRFVAFIVFYLI